MSISTQHFTQSDGFKVSPHPCYIFFYLFIKTHARHHYYETLKSQLVDTPKLNYAITGKSLTKTKKKELKKHWGDHTKTHTTRKYTQRQSQATSTRTNP